MTRTPMLHDFHLRLSVFFFINIIIIIWEVVVNNKNIDIDILDWTDAESIIDSSLFY